MESHNDVTWCRDAAAWCVPRYIQVRAAATLHDDSNNGNGHSSGVQSPGRMQMMAAAAPLRDHYRSMLDTESERVRGHICAWVGMIG